MNIKKIRPLLNHVVTTADVYTADDITSVSDNFEGQFKEYQKVIAVGPNVTSIKPGEIVVINPQAYARPVHKRRESSVEGLSQPDEVEMMVQFPIITVNNIPCLFLYDRDIDFVIEEFDTNDSLIR